MWFVRYVHVYFDELTNARASNEKIEILIDFLFWVTVEIISVINCDEVFAFITN